MAHHWSGFWGPEPLTETESPRPVTFFENPKITRLRPEITGKLVSNHLITNQLGPKK
jgi:hypothetical protein